MSGSLAAFVDTGVNASVPLLIDALRQEGLDVPSDSLFMDAVHLSKAGHAAMADLLAEELVPVLGRGR